MQSIGERLEEARKRKGISIREAAESTKIRSDYLHKFENNQFDIRLPEIYVRGFLRSYSNFLKLPADKIIADYNALNHGETKSGRTVSREVYGRMDISTTKEKELATAPTGGTTPPMPVANPATSTPAATASNPNAPRNPATFVPPHSGGSPIDMKLILKAAIAVVGLSAIIILAIVIFSGRPGNASASSETWVRAQGNEATITLASKDAPVKARVSSLPAQGGGPVTVYFEGTIPLGESRVIPHRTDIEIICEKPENLTLTAGAYTGPFVNNKGELVKRGTLYKTISR